MKLARSWSVCKLAEAACRPIMSIDVVEVVIWRESSVSGGSGAVQMFFKAPWMPDRTEANPNELNQDDARYGFRCCHLKNIWTAPLPPETELSRQMTTSTTSIDIMGLQA